MQSEMDAQVFVMVMEDAPLIRMDGTVYAKLAGVEQAATLSWKWLVLMAWIMMVMV